MEDSDRIGKWVQACKIISNHTSSTKWAKVFPLNRSRLEMIWPSKAIVPTQLGSKWAYNLLFNFSGLPAA
jgi:hypothetical protein